MHRKCSERCREEAASRPLRLQALGLQRLAGGGPPYGFLGWSRVGERPWLSGRGIRTQVKALGVRTGRSSPHPRQDPGVNRCRETNITFDPPAILRAERDHVVQGTAAELLQLAIMRVDRALVHTGARMIAAVHDEARVLEWPEADVATVAPRVVAEMIAAYRTLIPQAPVAGLVNAGCGNSWAAAKAAMLDIGGAE